LSGTSSAQSKDRIILKIGATAKAFHANLNGKTVEAWWPPSNEHDLFFMEGMLEAAGLPKNILMFEANINNAYAIIDYNKYGEPFQIIIYAQPAVAAFALVVTLCIAAYNKRNDQHYDELVARAAELEREGLGLPHGSFAQRPTTWLRYGPVPVEHRWPIGLVYAAAAALWTYILVKGLPIPSWYLRVTGLPIPSCYRLALELLAPALVIACWRWLRYMERTARKQLRCAVRSLKHQLVTEGPPGKDAPQQVIRAIVAKRKELRVCEKKAERRVLYHWQAYAEKHDERAGSGLLSAVIDLPARWIEDLWTNRR
jgi:hypothetical protein